MIRINLLPFRAIKRKGDIQRQLFVFAAAVVLVVLLIAVFSWTLSSQVTELRAENSELKKELDSYAEIIKEIDALKKKIEDLRVKLDVIQKLEEKKAGPVRLFDEIAIAVPKGKLFLKSLSESEGTVRMVGCAIDNDTVALFMTNLEKSEYISRVELVSTKLRNLPKFKLRVSDFTLNCRTYAFQAKPKATAKKKGKKRKR